MVEVRIVKACQAADGQPRSQPGDVVEMDNARALNFARNGIIEWIGEPPKQGPAAGENVVTRTGEMIRARVLKGFRPNPGEPKAQPGDEVEVDAGVFAHFEANGIVARL